MKYQVKQVGRNEIEHIRQLCIRSWAEYERAVDESNWQLLRNTIHSLSTYEDLLLTSQGFGVFEDDGALKAIAFVTPSGKADNVYAAEWSRLRYVSVDPESRAKSYGRLIVQRCMEFARDRNERWMALHTSEAMNAARHIYESMGFERLREIDSKYGMRYWLYCRAL